MGIGAFLTELAEGLASWLPALASSLVETFMALFFTTAEGGATTLNTLGAVCISFFIIGLGFRVLPAVLGWLRARWTARRSFARSFRVRTR